MDRTNTCGKHYISPILGGPILPSNGRKFNSRAPRPRRRLGNAFYLELPKRFAVFEITNESKPQSSLNVCGWKFYGAMFQNLTGVNCS